MSNPYVDLSKPTKKESPYRVLGIAFVVDQRGSGAKLVARYPTQPTFKSREKKSSKDPDAGLAHSKEDASHREDDDLFFTLTDRQMAKLFRTKKALCGNPMTLSINGTMFCCRAVLMEEGVDEMPPTVNESSSSSQQADNLVLFSVIVAMAAPSSHATVRFAADSWVEDSTDDQIEIQKFIKENNADASNAASGSNDYSKKEKGMVASSYLSIRRVHISLARFCRVLEREERRCHYISLQTKQFAKIRSEQQKHWEQKKAAIETFEGTKNGGQALSSSNSVMTGMSAQSSSDRRKHKRTSSVSAPLFVGEDLHSQAHKHDFTLEEEQEKEQEILELMLAAAPPEPSTGRPQHHGNLVRELVQVFHSLSRHDQVFPKTPESLLVARDSVVYVNQHIAVPIDAAGPRASLSIDNPSIRPYYTLLFPHASPSDLLQALQSFGSSPPQRLQQLLLTVNAQKPLTEIALDANLSLHTTLEMASYLVTRGACVVSPVVSWDSRLKCNQLERICDLGLDFAQLLGSVHIFRVINFLTSSTTLGDAMSKVTNTANEEGAWFRDHFLDDRRRVDYGPLIGLKGEQKSPGGPNHQSMQAQDIIAYWKEDIEERLYAMAVWLVSHRVLGQLQEYFVVVGTDHDDIAPLVGNEDFPSSHDMQSSADEDLFRELLVADLLNGDISIVALSWRLGLDRQKVRAWGLRHRRIRVVSRMVKPGDDWDRSPLSLNGEK